ncbi:MAG: transposase [Planctomycetota bacterium]
MPPPHRRRYETLGHARFLTFSCYQRLPLFQNPKIRDHFADALRGTQAATRFDLIAWVVIPDHVHLLLVPDLPDHPIPLVLERLKRPFAQAVLDRWAELDAPVLARLTDARSRRRFWQRGGGYDRNLTDEKQVITKAEYIHANPVRRGLVDSPQDWPWSSAAYYAGLRDVLI